MDGVRWKQIQMLFHAAANLKGDERRTFLEAACGRDAALLSEVAGMLEEDARGGTVLDEDVSQIAHRMTGNGAPLPFHLDEVGPYRILRLLGEGGMGVVYLAEREDLGSAAAIKILRDAWLSPARRDRFLSEQRTLAQLNHPAIARLYDADTLADGTPWFAMEYVDGRPLSDYCRERRLPLRERLLLFRAVCEAVQHAHRYAVIHRDLKPSNILVKPDGTPRLLDFGIAKQLERRNEPVDQTRTSLRLMTPAYAAPEQIRGERVGVYTDVYSLGVIFYELLAGRLPFDLRKRTSAGAEAIILEKEPEKPSAAARESREAHELSASKRAWAELDIVCLTAMHKDVQRRYRSVEALIRDIDHYLNDEPLEARPDTLRYRLAKFASRNRRALAASCLVAGLILALVGFFTVRLATERSRALAEAARTRRIQHFMLNLFGGGDQEAGPADSLRVTALLERGVQEARMLEGQPDLQAELEQTLGTLYQKLGKLDRADALLRAALERRKALYGPEHAEVAESLLALGLLRVDQARLKDAERLVREGLAMARRTLPADHPEAARGEAALGRVLQSRGAYDQAIRALDAAVRLQSKPGMPASDLASSLSELANTQFYAGRYAIAEALNRRVLEMHRRIYGGSHPLIADDLINLSAIHLNLGHYSEAESFARQALEINRSWYGPDHPETASSLTFLGQALVRRKRYAEALDLLQQALAIQERVYGTEHPRVATTLNELGSVALQMGKLDDAEARFRRIAGIYRTVYGGQHYTVGIALSNLASVFLERKRYSKAEPLFREAIAIYEKTLSADHANIGIARIKLGRVLLRERRYKEAEAQSLPGYNILMKQTSPSVTWLKSARTDLAAIYNALKQPEKAAAFRAGATAKPG